MGLRCLIISPADLLDILDWRLGINFTLTLWIDGDVLFIITLMNCWDVLARVSFLLSVPNHLTPWMRVDWYLLYRFCLFNKLVASGCSYVIRIIFCLLFVVSFVLLVSCFDLFRDLVERVVLKCLFNLLYYLFHGS